MAFLSESQRPVALLTGVRGFTGRYVAQALSRAGYQVEALADECGVPVDLADRAAVAACVARVRPVVAIHLAAISYVAHDDAEEIYKVNLIGSRHLLEALSYQVGLRRVILASSANVYGNASGMVAEDAPPAPQSDYAVSKLAMEYVASLWAARLPITVTRPFNYTGVGQAEKFLLPKIVSHFRRRAPAIELGNLDVWRDFNDVRAVAEAYVRLLDAPEGTYNICTGRLYALRDVVAMMAEIAGYPIRVEVNPAFVRANEVHELCGDPRRLEAAIGVLPEFPLAETLRWMYSAPTDGAIDMGTVV